MNDIGKAFGNAPIALDDYSSYLHDVLDDIEEVENPTELFPPAFRFFEEHADADLGSPGPLVHFLERFYPQYLDELCTSVARKPTTYTVWMLNRILNKDLPEATRERLVDALRSVASDPAASSEVREQSRRFLQHQS